MNFNDVAFVSDINSYLNNPDYVPRRSSRPKQVTFCNETYLKSGKLVTQRDRVWQFAQIIVAVMLTIFAITGIPLFFLGYRRLVKREWKAGYSGNQITQIFVKAKTIPPISLNPPTPQKKSILSRPYLKAEDILNKNSKNLKIEDFKKTDKTVSGTGSGKCDLYENNDGITYVMKKNNVVEFYAGMLFKLILGNSSPNMVFVKSDEEGFYVGSQFDGSYHEIWDYHRTNGHLLDKQTEGLAEIAVASFLLGDIDLKGLSSASSNIGVIGDSSNAHYLKIDHEQSFVFGGSYWRESYQMSKENLKAYCKSFKLDISENDLEKAIQKIAGIPIKEFEQVCDFCETLIHDFPTITKNVLENKKESLLININAPHPFKTAVMARIEGFQKLALQPKPAI